MTDINDKDRERAQEWQILWEWYNRYKDDRHVPSLFLRSDPVLHELANRINAALAEARAETAAAKDAEIAELRALMSTLATEEETAGAIAEIERLKAEIEDWRGRLATQCGETRAMREKAGEGGTSNKRLGKGRRRRYWVDVLIRELYR